VNVVLASCSLRNSTAMIVGRLSLEESSSDPLHGRAQPCTAGHDRAFARDA
jgi:hypothetical protein